MLLAATIERLYDLNVGIIGVGAERHERPHKPLLLLAAFDLIDEGLAAPNRIPWCAELRTRFTRRFEIVRKHDDKNSPDNPFFFLRGDGVWQAMKLGQSPKTNSNSSPSSGSRTRAGITPMAR